MSDQSTISDFQPESSRESEIYECEICDRTFDSSKGRGIHRAKAHAEDEIKEEMLAELQRLATELGKTPSQREMNEQGRFSVKAYQNCSIENAVRERDHSVLVSFLRLLRANERMISRNCRYQNCERRAESCVRLTVE